MTQHEPTWGQIKPSPWGQFNLTQPAHSLGLRMVAEGVETTSAYTELTRLGCDQA